MKAYELNWPQRIVLALAGAVLLSLSQGCSPPTGMRKITAWGLWAVPFGAPVGIGYWHSEHGVGVESEQSDKPTEALKVLPGKAGATKGAEGLK